MTTYLIGAVICLALSAFFSGSEMAFSSANRIRLENQAEDGSKLAALAVRIIDQFDDALSAILIGNNFVNIAISSLGSVIAITAFGEEDTWIATVIVTVSVIIFGETMPKIVAKKNANRLALAFAGPVRFLTIVFKPLTLLVVGLVRLVTRTTPWRSSSPSSRPRRTRTSWTRTAASCCRTPWTSTRSAPLRS